MVDASINLSKVCTARPQIEKVRSMIAGSSPALATKSLNKFLHSCINEVDSSERTGVFNPFALITEGFVIFVI
jgi:hypothetical protein